jgi:hypothetical protein
MRDYVPVMTEERPSEVLGALPHTRPHRRSQKRAARPANGTDAARPADRGDTVEKTEASKPKSGAAKKASSAAAPRSSSPRRRPAPRKQPLRQPAQPAGTPAAPRTRKPVPRGHTDVLGTAVQATGELAEITLTVSARALRGAIARLPRP